LVRIGTRPVYARDLLTAIALVLVIEGCLYALFPEGMQRAAARATVLRGQTLRIVGLAAACADVRFSGSSGIRSDARCMRSATTAVRR
jgi:uncharacterized protein